MSRDIAGESDGSALLIQSPEDQPNAVLVEEDWVRLMHVIHVMHVMHVRRNGCA